MHNWDLSRLLGLVGTAALAFGVSLPAQAQNAAIGSPGETQAPQTTQTPDDAPVRPARPTIVPPGTGPAAQPLPVRPNQPGSPAAELGLGVNPPLIREGAFVAAARGQMVRGKSGRWYFIFERDATGRTLPPMILAESPNLAAMERLSERAAPGTRLRVGGRVLVYRDANYLLVTTPPLLEQRSPTANPEFTSSPPQTPSEPAPGSSSATGTEREERSLDQIIADLDRVAGPSQTAALRRPTIPSEPAPTGSNAGDFTNTSDASDNTPPADARTLGFLTSRRGRLVRASDGWLTFRLDTGAAGRSQPAMTILPCLNLVRLEDLFDASGESTTITMSGEVLVYRGRQFLLPSMFSVNRSSGNLTPMH